MKVTVVGLISLFLVPVIVAQFKRNDSCTAPTGKAGKCIPLSTCDIIRPIIQQSRKRNATALQLARAYQCGHDTEVLICCDSRTPTTNPPKPPTKTRRPIYLNDFNSTDLPDRSICGVSPQENDRIFGGNATDLEEFPWVAALEYVKRDNPNENGGVRCGGSLINERYVLTAAHCIADKEFKVFKVRLGEWNVTSDPDCVQEDNSPKRCTRVEIFDIEKEIPHEYYDKGFSRNDIGLLKLSRDAKFTTNIRPICLPPPDLPLPDLETYMTVVGWGLTELGSTSEIKLKVDVPLVANQVCKDKLPSKPITRNNYCAGGELNRDACTGDSGGPLMRSFQNRADVQEQWFLEGIVGSGISCGRSGTPGIYLRVTEYTKWVIDLLAEDKTKSRSSDNAKYEPAYIHFEA